MPPGVYTLPYSVRATGQSPQVGASILAFDYIG